VNPRTEPVFAACECDSCRIARRHKRPPTIAMTTIAAGARDADGREVE
jgi:hypothetical protein